MRRTPTLCGRRTAAWFLVAIDREIGRLNTTAPEASRFATDGETIFGYSSLIWDRSQRQSTPSSASTTMATMSLVTAYGRPESSRRKTEGHVAQPFPYDKLRALPYTGK